MSKLIENGGPAFPCEVSGADGELRGAQTGPYTGMAPGMSLRDYFAIHADQPGRLEISSAAGVRLREHHPDYQSAEASALPTWDRWFNSLSQEYRYELYAKVRYQIADAMLAARNAEPAK